MLIKGGVRTGSRREWPMAMQQKRFPKNEVDRIVSREAYLIDWKLYCDTPIKFTCINMHTVIFMKPNLAQ